MMRKFRILVLLLILSLIPFPASSSAETYAGCPETWNLVSKDVESFKAEMNTAASILGPNVAWTDIAYGIQEKGEWYNFFDRENPNPSEIELFTIYAAIFPSKITFKIEVKNCANPRIYSVSAKSGTGFLTSNYERISEDFSSITRAPRPLFGNFKDEDDFFFQTKAQIQKLQIQAKTFRESGGFFGYVRSGKQTGVEAMRIEPMLRFNGLANVYLVPESISCLALSADLRGNKFEKLMFPRGMFLKAGTNCNFKLILKYANQEGQNFYFAIDSFSIPTKTPVKACLSTSTGSSKRNLISPAINGKCQKGYKLVK